jgi:hypothetical protein
VTLSTAGTTLGRPVGATLGDDPASAIPISTLPLPSDSDLRKRYGITLDDYIQLLEDQGGRCRACGAVPTRRPLVVDHDHDPPYPIDGLICVGENRYATQKLRRYFKSRPGVQLFVPAEREEMAKQKREREKAAARAKRAAKPTVPAVTVQDRFNGGAVPKIGAQR